MIYLLSLLCSMCIQFAAVDIPTMIIPNFMPSDVISSGFDSMSMSGGIWSYYSDVGLSEDGIFITSYDRIDYFEVKYYVPVQPYISTVTSSYTLNTYATVNNGNFIVGGLNLNGYSCYVYYYYKQNQSSNFGAQQWHNYNNQSFEFSYPVGYSWPVLAYTTSPLYYNNELVIVPKDYVEVPDYEGLGSLGSLSSSGHSSDNSPFDALDNSSINWGSMTGHSSGGVTGPSPHSSSTHFNNTTPSPDSNDSKTDSLLYMIGNKLADITENTGAIGDALGGIMYNQVTGAIALFNAISGLNDNFVSAFTPPSKEEFSAVLQTSEIYASYQNVTSSVTAMTTTLNSVGQQSGYIWEITLPETWGGSLSFNFSNYLDTNTLNFIRILIGAILIISTIVFVAHQFPDIIGGGSGGENA